MKIQCFHLCRKKFLNRPKSLPSPKGPLLMDDLWTHKEMWQQAHSQDSWLWFCLLRLGMLWFQEQHPLEPTRQTLKDEVEEGLPHGCPWVSPTLPPLLPAYGRIRLKSVETSQISERRNSINFHAGGCSPPRNVMFRLQGEATIFFH